MIYRAKYDLYTRMNQLVKKDSTWRFVSRNADKNTYSLISLDGKTSIEVTDHLFQTWFKAVE